MKTIEEYIRNAAAPTQSILVHLRELIKQAEPKLQENIKWNAPSFEYNGKIVCNMMAFKKHVNLMFHQGKELNDSSGVLVNIGEKSNMKGLKQIEKLSDLPEDDQLISLVQEAVQLAKN